jgi:hypothetical protein
MNGTRKWDDAEARREATRAFCVFLHKPENAQVREKCKNDSAYARTVFAEQGGFSPDAIPKETEFRVFEEKDMFPRDKLVTLVLPPVDKPLAAADKIDVPEVYRCTWVPY